MLTTHSRYRRFFDYGDVEAYRQDVEQVRRDFMDLTNPAPGKEEACRPPAESKPCEPPA